MRGGLFANGIDGMQRRRRPAVARARRQEGGCSQEQREQERHQERQQESRKEGHQERQQLDKGRTLLPASVLASIGTAFHPLRGAVLQDAELRAHEQYEIARQELQKSASELEEMAAATMESLTNGLQSALAHTSALECCAQISTSQKWADAEEKRLLESDAAKLLSKHKEINEFINKGTPPNMQ